MKELKIRSFIKLLLAVVAIVGFQSNSTAQDSDKPYRESFEDETVIMAYKSNDASDLSISAEHRRFGESSLKWEWSGKSYFQTTHFQHLPRGKSPLRYGDHFPSSPILVMSVYNENPQNGEIRVSYGINGREEVWFPLPLNFSGWRTIRVPFFEMNGNPPKKNEGVNYNYFMISSYDKNASGALFFDDIVFSQFQDDRYPYPDMLVPFIKDDLPPGIDHWTPLIRNLERIRNLAPKSLSEEIKKDLAIVEKRIDAKFSQPEKSQVPMSKVLKEYQKLKLKVKKDNVLGPALTYKIDEVYLGESMNNKKDYQDIKELGQTLKKLAVFYLQANKEDQPKIEELFITASRYYLDQGWQGGSSGGTRHHIGYNVRELTEAFYIMKEPLRKAGIQNEVGESLKWLFNLGKILGPEEEFKANIDYFNTQSFYHLMLIFLTEDIKERAALLDAYSNYISVTLAQYDEKGVFKVDGTVWHHHGHYPAYGLGAFRSITPIIHALSGTQFQIHTEGHQNFKKAFLATRLYSQLYDYGFGNAGRHPLENNNISRLKQNYLHMAYTGNPEHTLEIDRELAAAYLRLWGEDDEKNSKKFKEVHNIEAEKLPGYSVFPYAATAVHRRDNWAAIIKGYSKYVWASEIYVDENRYGRYSANGSIQLYNAGGDVGSGFNQNGWNWNRYPGTTVIVLPFEDLEPETPLIMFKSDESFAGAAKLEGNGVFGMKLNEQKGSNADGPEKNIGYPGELKANKSVFSFGEKLICIGTGISSIDSLHPVQTNIFQNFLPEKTMPVYTSGSAGIKKFPYQSIVRGKHRWLIDAYRNGYHFLSDNEVEVRKQKQDSYHNKYSIRTGKMNPKGKGATVTYGDYAVAWIDHGKAPKEASYQYVIYPDMDEQAIAKFEKKIKKNDSYNIIRADNTAHIVRDNPSATTGYVIFDAEEELNDTLLQKVSSPSIVMIKLQDKEHLIVSAVEPDLNIPDFKKKTYSGYSFPVELSLTLKGNWQLEDDSDVKSISSFKDVTTITIENRHGFSKLIKLIRT
jgi:chondroitin-sulfate-ABC endolyase/exolyase